jgi:hypothetical protein
MGGAWRLVTAGAGSAKVSGTPERGKIVGYKIVKKDGYNPPTTPFELASLLNDWAIFECREQKP